MDRNFDIFKIGPIGNALWRDSVANSTAAKSRVAKLSMVVPGEYLMRLLSQSWSPPSSPPHLPQARP